ncbi:P-loop containing nucleoside triphosphate hydrolase protein [Panaeolus papilionaceus]|nr:P-loop containing nucleoside triphosphate hydrolase protein [Panaeolus papilionaceus]
MPRIRKKTSNRVKVNDREKLKKKVRDGKKKKAKLAKKNVQWKSKHKKDPGIPNEFPYKDQILAEVAEQRRIAVEEKQRRKEEKQKNLERARAIARGEILPDEDMESAEERSENEEEGSGDEAGDQSSDGEEEAPKKGSKDLNVGAESIASLSAKQLDIKLKQRLKAKAVEEIEEEDEVPLLINRDLPNLQSVIDKADVVVELLDARDPEAFRNKKLEDLVVKKGKKLLLILNKIDTCPKESVSAWIELLRKQYPTLAFRSATSFLPETSTADAISSLSSKAKGKFKAKAPTNDAVGRDVVLDCLSAWRKDSGKDELSIAVVGIVNSGKSSFINSINKRASLPVYTLATSSRGPSTTELPQEATLEVDEQKFTFIDTPGLSFISDEEADSSLLEEFRSRDILLRSKGRIDRLKDPNPPIEHIVSRANTEDLMVLYSLPAFTKGDPTAFLSGVARANQLIKKENSIYRAQQESFSGIGTSGNLPNIPCLHQTKTQQMMRPCRLLGHRRQALSSRSCTLNRMPSSLD